MATEAPTTFGTLLRQFRLAAGMTQEMLADRAGMSVRGLSDLERARRLSPHYETVRLLAEALDLSPEDAATLLAAARPAPVQPPPDAPGAPPAPLTSIIGRESECLLIGRRFVSDAVRVLTLTGPGGVGKTRLALQVAEEARATLAYDAVWFVSLAPVRDPQQVLTTIAAALGLTESTTTDALPRLRSYLRQRRGLLVLDNFEHLLPAAPDVAELLAACPSLKVLVTSRAVLHLSGEHEFRLAPLALPDTPPSHPLAGADFGTWLRTPAIALLVERLRAVDALYEARNADVPALVEICRRVDGLPLGIELAAAQSRYFSLTEVARRLGLGDVPGQRAAAPRDLPARQHSLHDTIVWSYALLSPKQQRLLRWLAVFVGGWTREEVEKLAQTAPASKMPLADVTEGLTALIDASLIAIQRETEGPVRYTMLETIREFAEEQLVASGEEARARECHADLLLDLSERMERGLQSAYRTAWSRAAVAELDNMRAALRWSLARGNPKRALRIVGNLDWFWDAVGRDREGLAWSKAALALPGAQQETVAYGRALASAGALAWNASEFRLSLDLLTQSVAILRRQNDARSLGQALFNLSMTARYTGEDTLAVTAMREGLALIAALDEPWLLGAAYFGLGEVLYEHDVPGARDAYECSLTIYRALGDLWGTAHALNGLGGLAMRAGEYSAARTHMEEALALRRTAKNPHAIATSLISLGELARRAGDDDQAHAALEEGLVRFRELGDDEHIAWALQNLALVALRRDDERSATEALDECLSLRQSQGNLVPILDTLDVVASLANHHGDTERAEGLLAALTTLRPALTNADHSPAASDSRLAEAIALARTILRSIVA